MQQFQALLVYLPVQTRNPNQRMGTGHSPIPKEDKIKEEGNRDEEADEEAPEKETVA